MVFVILNIQEPVFSFIVNSFVLISQLKTEEIYYWIK